MLHSSADGGAAAAPNAPHAVRVDPHRARATLLRASQTGGTGPGQPPWMGTSTRLP